MNQELKTKWLKALRSDKYKQGRGSLRTKDDKFCCLGVLCDILDEGEWVPQDATYNFVDSYGNVSCGVTHPNLEERYGIDWDGATKALQRNDRGETFPEIADFIEANL